MPLRNLPRSRVMLDDSHPTILIDAAIAPKLVILGSPSIGSFGCIEGISHTYAVDRLLGNAADAFGRRLARCLQYGGADVNAVLVLTSNLALRLDAFRPEIGRAASRERGCPYVLIPVVAGSLKKKN